MNQHPIDALINRLADEVAERVAAKLQQPRPRSAQRLLNAAEAAAFLGISKPAVYRRVTNGTLPFVRDGNRAIRFDINDLEHWISKRKVA